MKPRFVLPLLSVVALGQSAGTFTATGSMITPRFQHTATVLPDGRVLIAGGDISCVAGPPPPCVSATTAELYDPASGTFSATGIMNTIPVGGGILLPDGKVFFATGAPARIEFYDPSNGEFKLAGASASLSVVSSAALLNDGTVFMTGYNGSASGAEIYDPVADAFSPIGTWPTDLGEAAVLAVLPDNRVLLDVPDSCDGISLIAIFDPATGAVTTQSRWSFDYDAAASLLLDGKVLLSGGNFLGADVNSAELFDPSDGMFLVTGNMLFVRDGHTSTLLPDGKVLVAGGATTFNEPTHAYNVTGSAELYDPAASAFSLTGSMTTPRQYHAAVLLNDGRVLITGGVETNPPEEVPGRLYLGISSAELYTPDKLIPAPVLYSLSGDGQGQGAIWHASTGDIASAAEPATAGEALSMYTTSLAEGGVIPPQMSVGGRLAEILYFGDAPGYPGYFQVNFRVPGGVALGPAVPVRLTYLARPSNEVTIAIH